MALSVVVHDDYTPDYHGADRQPESCPRRPRRRHRPSCPRRPSCRRDQPRRRHRRWRPMRCCRWCCRCLHRRYRSRHCRQLQFGPQPWSRRCSSRRPCRWPPTWWQPRRPRPRRRPTRLRQPCCPYRCCPHQRHWSRRCCRRAHYRPRQVRRSNCRSQRQRLGRYRPPWSAASDRRCGLQWARLDCARARGDGFGGRCRADEQEALLAHDRCRAAHRARPTAVAAPAVAGQ